MSFYKSLEQLWIKIQQKNVVLVSGNVDELISTSSQGYKKLIRSNNNSSYFIDLTEFLSIKSKEEFSNLDLFSYFSPIKGNIITSKDNDSHLLKEKNTNSNDEFLDFDENNSSQSLEEYIDWISTQLTNFKNDYDKTSRALFILNFSDILLNNASNLVMLKLAQLLEAFIEFKNVISNKFKNDYYKLVIIARNPNMVNSLITNNNEFASINISKPNKDEREEFFKLYRK